MVTKAGPSSPQNREEEEPTRSANRAEPGRGLVSNEDVDPASHQVITKVLPIKAKGPPDGIIAGGIESDSVGIGIPPTPSRTQRQRLTRVLKCQGPPSRGPFLSAPPRLAATALRASGLSRNAASTVPRTSADRNVSRRRFGIQYPASGRPNQDPLIAIRLDLPPDRRAKFI